MARHHKEDALILPSGFEFLKKLKKNNNREWFNAGHEAIDLLRYKQFLLIRPFSDKEVLSKGFLKEAGLTFKAMRPFFDHMSEVLVTDSNGMEK